MSEGNVATEALKPKIEGNKGGEGVEHTPEGVPADTLASVNAWREGQGLPPVVKPGEKDKRERREISEERIDLSKISDREAREKAYRLEEERRARERADREEANRRSEQRREQERIDREAVERRLFSNRDNRIDKTRSSR